MGVALDSAVRRCRIAGLLDGLLRAHRRPGGAEDADPAPLGDYLLRVHEVLAETSAEPLLAGDLAWPTLA